MKAIILAAGYATRLYPLTKDRPKALLPIADRPIIDYIIDEIETISEINQIYIASNDKFYGHFEDWKKNKESRCILTVVNDGTTGDENKLGAIGDIDYIIKKEKITEDLLVIAGDNFFTFKLLDFYKFYEKVNKDCILVKKIDSLKDLRRMGVALLDKDSRVLDMEEKPQNPKSNLAVYAAYIYSADTLPLFHKYIEDGFNPDAPGFFPSWLHKVKDVYAYEFTGDCYDIGTVESYNEVTEMFSKNL